MIPVVTIGKGITGAVRYMMGQGNDPVTGERLELAEGEETRAEILGGQNFGFAIESGDELDLARRMMEWSALPGNQAGRTKKCVNDCLSASLSWEKGQEPSKAEMVEAAQSYLKSIGMENARAVFVTHRDTEHAHMHIVASRIDPVSRKTISDGEIFIKSQAWGLQWEREHGQRSQCESRQRLHKILDAIEARDGAALVEILTERTPTFTGRELDKMLAYGMADKRELAAFKGEILAQQNVIGLREKAEGEVYRYTTREVLAAEMALLRGAHTLAADQSHGLDAHRIASTAAAHTLKPEQADALRHLTGAEGFAMLWGEAGTGKSHTLNATRAAYETKGAHVIGLSWTNGVVQQMKGDGFTRANTIASELKSLEHGRAQWDRNTVLIVDEAAMVSTANLAALTEAAGRAGAKLILAGDDKQLSSIERGGMFETLRQTHGAAILKDVQRVADMDQKQAFGKMHEGEFLDALRTFEKAGGIHWAEKQKDALRGMAEKYSADSLESPEKRRFMFAFSNAEVDALNNFARDLHKSRGELGEDHALQTSRGAAHFATGDRIQLTGSGYSKADRDAGYTNGRVGTITAIETEDGKPLVTVELDARKGKEPQRLEFIVGDDAEAGEFNAIRHGYAGTIYKGQGKTLDESYVCHSSSWRSSAAYVALTRHRESVHIFAAHETVPDIEAMAEGLKRPENKRAASAYQIDAVSALRFDFDDMAQRTTRPAPEQDPLSGWRDVHALHAAAAAERRQQQREVVLDALSGAFTFAPREEAFTGKDESRAMDGAARGLDGVASGVARVADGLANFASRAIEFLADFFGGASSPPPPSRHEQGQAAAPPPEPPPYAGFVAPSKPRQTIEEFLEAEQREQQQQKALEALARAQGLGRPVISEADLRMQEESEQKRSRDRGGGIGR